MTGYSLEVCVDFVRIGTASAWRFDGVVRRLAAGEWQLSVPLAGLDINPTLIRSINSVVVADPDDQIVFAGLMRPIGSSSGSMVRFDTADGTRLVFDGVDLFGVLAVRQAWPTPAELPPWTDAYDVRTGVGSTVAAEFIEYNIGVDAIDARKVVGLEVVDPIVGTESTWSARLQRLDELVGRICRDSGVTCRAVLTPDREIRFVFESPSDRSASVLFTDQGDLISSERMFAQPSATYVVAAGQGELTDRDFAVADSGATGIGRTESVYEAVNTSTMAGLFTSATTQLGLSAAATSVDAEIATGAAQRIRYLHEYNVGDWIGVEIDGERDTAQVEAVRFTLTANDSRVVPVLGRRASNAAVHLLRDVEDLQSRFDRSIS